MPASRPTRTVVVLNVTAVAPVERGYVTVHPTGTDRPNASNVNYYPGHNTANEVIARVGTNGSVSIYTHTATHLVIDIAGHLPTEHLHLQHAAQRLVDTRPGFDTIDGQDAGIGRRSAGSTLDVQVAGRAGIPANATVVVLNVTAVAPLDRGYVTVHPTGTDRPNASNVNYYPGHNTANEVIARVGANGSVSIYTHTATHLVIDIAGHLDADPDAIDWDAVGSGWVQFTSAMPDVLDDPAAEFDVTLMLLSPTGQAYVVGQLPGPYPRSHHVVDLSTDGRTALMVTYDEARNTVLAGGSPHDVDDHHPNIANGVVDTDSATTTSHGSSRSTSRRHDPPVDGSSTASHCLGTALDGTSPELLVDLPLTPEQQLSGQHFELRRTRLRGPRDHRSGHRMAPLTRRTAHPTTPPTERGVQRSETMARRERPHPVPRPGRRTRMLDRRPVPHAHDR